MKGKVEYIYVAENAGESMCEVDSVRAIEGRGLEGDRYCGERGSFSKSGRKVKRHVSLMSWDEFAHRAYRTGQMPFNPSETRRNIFVSGLELNNLVGKEFFVGEVRMKGVELCHPCEIPSRLAGKPGFKEFFKGCGGLRAEILTSGWIAKGGRAEAITYKCLICGLTTLYPHDCPAFNA